MPGVLRRPDTVQEGAGEAVTARSPLIRDAWDNNKHRKNRAKDTKDARPVSPKAIANMMGELLKKTHLRDPDSRMPAGGGAAITSSSRSTGSGSTLRRTPSAPSKPSTSRS